MQYSPDRIIQAEHPTIGVVIGTYGSPCYVHLGLEMLRRTSGELPVLVHDDASFETAPQEHATLQRVCDRFGADFSCNQHSYGHMQGDFTAFISGWRWAQERQVDILIKFSRRFIPLVEWASQLQRLAYVTQYATFSNGDACHALGFRTECVAMHVHSWINSGVLDQAYSLMESNTNWFVELIVHNLARTVHKMNCRFNKLYELVNPPIEPDLSYGMWPLMGGSRCVRSTQYLWRDAYSPAEYYQQACSVGVTSYSLADFSEFKEH